MTETKTTTAQPIVVGERLCKIKAKIASIARAKGRDPATIRLIAVSKRKPVADIVTAYDAGQRDFGENIIQEARDKIPRIGKAGIDWHFIGRLQKNKARYIPGLFQWLHSLDNLGLAQKLSRCCEQRSTQIKTLVQVNVSLDPDKQGVLPDQLFSFVESLLNENLAGIDLRGLMTIGQLTSDRTAIQRNFAHLRELRDQCRQRFDLPGFIELSMGMSSDYALAIQEGATMLRLGTAIFGDRQL